MKQVNNRRAASFFGRSVIALVFVVAAVAKSVDLNQFAQRIGDFGLVFDSLVTPTAWAIVLAELLIGIGLVLQLRHSLTAAVTLLLLFVGTLTYGIGLGLDIDCGCFGPAVHVSLGTQLLTDLGLLLLCAMIYWSERGNLHSLSPEASQNTTPMNHHE